MKKRQRVEMVAPLPHVVFNQKKSVEPYQAAEKKMTGYYHVSVYRLLYLFKQLVKYRALTYAEANTLFLEHEPIARGFSSETMTKYINTLRRFGCLIPKANGRQQFQYKLSKAPFCFDLNESDFNALMTVYQTLSMHPDEQLQLEYLDLLEQMMWTARLPQSIAERPLSVLIEEVDNLVADEQAQVRKFQQWCREKQALVVHYGTSFSNLKVYYIDLYDVLKNESGYFLVGYDRDSLQQIRLDIHKICQVRQLPCKVQNRLKWVNVQFKLTGRLAKTYRLYPDELKQGQTDDSLIIRARTIDADSLLMRLMKYGPYCEVLSPQYIRRQAIQRIDELNHVVALSS